MNVGTSSADFCCYRLFESFYKIEANGDAEVLIEQFGRRRNLLKKGGEVDIMRAAKEILKDWQKGKIKRN